MNGLTWAHLAVFFNDLDLLSTYRQHDGKIHLDDFVNTGFDCFT